MRNLSVPALEKLVAAATLLFFGCAILLPWAEVARFFVFGVAMTVSLYIACSRGWPNDLISLPFVGMGALVIYLVLNSAMVSDVTGHEDFRRLRWGVEILLFLLCLVFAFHYWMKNPRHMLISFSVISGLAAIIAVAVHLLSGDVSQRITGAGFLQHTIRGSSTLIMFWAIAAVGFVMSRDVAGRKELALLLLSGLCVGLFVVFSQSRGPAATFILLICLFLYCSTRIETLRMPKLKHVLIFGAFLSSLFVYSGALAFSLEVLASRGLSYRPEIWNAVIQHLPSYWLTGVGQATEFVQTAPGQALESELQHVFDHTHNVFLQALVVGGVPALVVLIVIIGYLGWGVGSVTSEPRTHRISMLAILVTFICVNLTDTVRLLSSPTPDWVLLWTPLAMCGVYLHMAKQGEMVCRNRSA